VSEIKTYRGRTVEELLPKIKSELGPEALIIARREGLAGGVGGFFQRSYVEVEARAPIEDPEVELRSDRATAEGFASPGVQRLVAEAAPFASQLEAAQHAQGIGLYGPQPAVPDAEVVDVTEAAPSFDADAGYVTAAAAAAESERQPAPEPEPAAAEPQREPAAEPPPAAPDVASIEASLTMAQPAPEPVAGPAPEPVATPAPQPVAAAPRPAPAAAPPTTPPPSSHADELRDLLEDAGLPNRLVREVLDEALRHGLPFASARSLESVVRAALVQRIATMAPIGAGARTVVIAGPAGSGKTTAAARLAAAYRGAGTGVRELAPGDPAVRTPFDGLTVVDVPSIGVRDTARIAAVAQALAGTGAEVHLALPATMSSPAAADVAAALAPLGLTHVLLTHADETSHPGAAIGHAMATGLPLSYVSGADELLPADATDLALRLVR
jgi:flagellar biosynthesis GTPase FlhF